MKIILAFVLIGSGYAATVVQMACGGPGGGAWVPDTKVGGGAYWTAANQSAMGAQPIPYQTLCYSSGTTPFSRTFTVPAGAYSVTLKFLEPNKTAAGQRLFNASINGAPVAIGLDVFAAASGALRPYDRTFQVQAPGGFIQVTLAGTLGNALLSAVQIDTAAPPDAGAQISCKSGIVKVGADIIAAAQTQEIEIMSNLPGSQRWEQIQMCITDRFLGQTRVTASMGRPGTNHNEMTGADVPMADSSGNAVCWTSRPTPGQFIGPYSVVIAINAWSKDPVTGAEIIGDLSKLTSGSLTWEACGYQGIIGNLNVAGQSTKPVVMQCSGSDSHIDPVTGKTYIADCTGMLWAKLPGLSILGVLADVGPRDPASHQIWRPIPNYVK